MPTLGGVGDEDTEVGDTDEEVVDDPVAGGPAVDPVVAGVCWLVQPPATRKSEVPTMGARKRRLIADGLIGAARATAHPRFLAGRQFRSFRLDQSVRRHYPGKVGQSPARLV